MAMFEIRNSSRVNLQDNSTTAEEFAYVDNVDQLSAKGNKAGPPQLQGNSNEDVFELKPNIYGLGINLKALWQKILRN